MFGGQTPELALMCWEQRAIGKAGKPQRPATLHLLQLTLVTLTSGIDDTLCAHMSPNPQGTAGGCRHLLYKKNVEIYGGNFGVTGGNRKQNE